jgi:hypothetical protein
MKHGPKSKEGTGIKNWRGGNLSSKKLKGFAPIDFMN